MNFLKKYFSTIGYLLYLIGLIIFIICHKYNHQILIIPTIFLIVYIAIISMGISTSRLRQVLNKVFKFLIFFFCVYEIAALLLIELIAIKWPKDCKHILFLSPTTSVNFIYCALNFIALFSIAIIFTSTNSNHLKLNKKKTFEAIINLLILIYSVYIILSALLNAVNFSLKDNSIINYTSTIFINCSFLISFGLIRLIDKNNPLRPLVFNKSNYFLIWPLLSLMLSLATLFCK